MLREDWRFALSPLIFEVHRCGCKCETPTNVQSECMAHTHTRAHYSFLGTFVMMGLGRILKINLRLMRAVTEYEVLLGS